MAKLRPTPSQTVGPFFAYGLTAEQFGYSYNAIIDRTIADPDTPGEHITITGRVFDGNGIPVPDAMLEFVQADAAGNFRTEPIELLAPDSPQQGRFVLSGTTRNGAAYHSPEFRGIGRAGTEQTPAGTYWMQTVKPGSVDNEAPHIDVTLFSRGSLRDLRTRIYFSDEAEANATDPLLNEVPAGRRHTLLAQRREQNGQVFYDFDIRMQGEGETVFFLMSE